MKLNNLNKFLKSPNDSLTNFNLALEYDLLDQCASAISFYLRAAEKTTNINLQYICLIRIGLGFDKQGGRNLTTKNSLERAISLLPNRPEGYLILSQLYESENNFSSSYLMANIGLTMYESGSFIPLPTIEQYYSKYKLLFHKAVASWWLGLLDEGKIIIHDLLTNYHNEMDDIYKIAVQQNFDRVGYPKNNLVYIESFINEIKYKFINIEKIKINYSQLYQDMFVLLMLNGKSNGTYLELGSGDPFYYNNTYLLETVFNWSGLSIDIDQSLVNDFNSKRKNPALCYNVLDLDYKILLENYDFGPIIDYLQVDCNPSEVSFNALKKVLDSGFKFKVITFEHDYYVDPSIKQLSRDYLISQGYTLVVNDVSFNYYSSFEDWWVLKDHVNFIQFNNLNLDNNLIKPLFFN